MMSDNRVRRFLEGSRSTEKDRGCPRCGRLIPYGRVDCAWCVTPGGFLRSAERQTLILISLVSLILLFVVTGLLAKFYHAEQKSLARQWYDRGQADLRAGRSDAALEDFRTALTYSPDNSLYDLRLAQALVQSNRLQEAEVY